MTDADDTVIATPAPSVSGVPNLIGNLLDNKYRITRLLGCGGLAAVYEATHEEMGRRVAIKILLPQWSSATQQIKRFRREAQLLSEMAHPGIAAVHACGLTADGELYLCLEYVEGTTLDAFLKLQPENHSLSSTQCCGLFLALAGALAFAHGRGIIHRDIKPQNIMIAVDETSGAINAKLLDFGIGKLFSDEAGQKLTATGAIVGSPAYMSPEQFSGDSAVGTRSDIYSFGCVLYQALTGNEPFKADTAFELMNLHLNQAPKEIPPAAGDAAHDSLAGVALKCMAKQPEQRFASMTEVCAALQQIHDAPGMPLKFSTAAATGGKLPTRRPGRNDKRLLAIGVILATVLGAAALSAFLLQRPQPEPVFSDAREANENYGLGEVEPDLRERKALMRKSAAGMRKVLATSPPSKLAGTHEMVLARCLRQLPEDPGSLQESRRLFHKVLQQALESRALIKDSNALSELADATSDCYLNLGMLDIMEGKFDDAEENFKRCHKEQLLGGSEGDWGPLWGLEMAYRYKRQPQEAKRYALLNAQMLHKRRLDEYLQGIMLADAALDIKEADGGTLKAATDQVRRLVISPSTSEVLTERNRLAAEKMDTVLAGIKDVETAHAYEVDSRFFFREPPPKNLR